MSLSRVSPLPRQLHGGHRAGEQRSGLEVPAVLSGPGVLQPPQHPLPLRRPRLLLHGGEEVLQVLL